MILEITSKDNPTYKELKKISQRRKSNNGLVLIEGKKLVLEALTNNVLLERVFIDSKNLNLFSSVLHNHKNIEIIYLENNLLASLFTTDAKPTSEDLIIAVGKKPKWKLTDLFEDRKNIIFLEKIQDPGNLGSILRSASAFNSSGVVLSEGSVEPFNTKVIRASAGALFKIPVVEAAKISEFHELAKKEKYKIIATAIKAKKKLTELDFSLPYVFIFGNEGRGISNDLINIADDVVSIPHSNNVESLNLSVAVSVVLWEAY